MVLGTDLKLLKPLKLPLIRHILQISILHSQSLFPHSLRLAYFFLIFVPR